MVDQEDSTPKGFGDFFLAIPWPWHLGLAVAVYLILHALATREIPLPNQTPEETALYAHRLVWKTAAWFFQYLLPAIFGLAAFCSFRRAGKWRKKKV
jgi:hypothetical protein